ncbi:peptide N-acetyl-beta-D-glucosaminyl asparaginase amidase A-domain-containing protein [Mycena rosella]|uniref:Peptide N-acetyl-beta-D-glucosaminyl asparaginase amidase A-domain-containing protein n=1 Tax=Mycena rosella TaxID=1033263 RepID=A0AAD7C963_MYCRO|nr:peptide N-acetyl-beta-D-glucosaminyl asparaginase amidase A-domain-containing protein [Mycena rosella]
MLYTALLLASLSCAVFAQPSPEELAPLLAGLAGQLQIERRVPLSTDDPTVAPLVDLQVFAPPVVPKNGESCTVTLLQHSFGDGSFNAPAVVEYIPPTHSSCGEVGKWATISLNLSVYSIGTQYDRLSAIYLSHSEIWRSSSAEPTKTGTIWNTIKDVTHFTPLFAKTGDLMMDFSNIISLDLLLDGVFDVILSATFYAPTKSFPAAVTSDVIIPLSNLNDTLPNFFTITDDIGGITAVTLPDTAVEAYVEVFCSGNSAEEFWYLNTPDEFVQDFPASSGLIGKGPFREIQVLIDDQLAGVVYGAYDQPTYWVDISPFIPVLLDEHVNHTVTLRVVGQGITAPSFNSDWFVSGSIHVRTGSSKTTGKMTSYSVPALEISTVGGSSPGNTTVWTKVVAHRELAIESELNTSEGKKSVRFSQSLDFSNEAQYADEGWIQWGEQTTIGTTTANHQGKQVLRDAFIYPLSVFSNYSLYTEEFGGYGSEINQTHIRALQPPIGPYRAIQSVQHARGSIGMDNWPGLRHAINGTGATDQTFAYVDGRGETYFRDIAAKNDGWVRDTVWGSLRDANPPEQSLISNRVPFWDFASTKCFNILSAGSGSNMVQVGSLSISPALVNASCAWASDLSQLQTLFNSPYTGAVITRTSTLGGFAEDASHTVAFASSSTSSLNSYGYSPHNLGQYLTWIESILSAAPPGVTRKPFIISTTASDASAMRATVAAVQALRATAPTFARIGIEFNTSCPNIRGAAPTGYTFPGLAPLLAVLAEAWRADRTLTLGLKLPPYVYAAQFAAVLDALRGLSVVDADGVARNPIAYVACTNTLGNALLFADQVEAGAQAGSAAATAFAVPTALGGLAGDALHALALGNVYSFARLLEAEPPASGLRDIVIVGIGGVTSAAAAARMRTAGATVVGSATLFGKEGVYAFKILSGE